jgi:hypothetical protein
VTQVSGDAVKSWKDLTRQDFIELNANYTGYKIAQMYGVTPSAVYYRFRMFGINDKRSSRKFEPPKDELEALYRQMSMKKIAEHYGVGETAVFMRLKELGIGGISRAERMQGKPKTIEHRLAMSRGMRESGSFAGSANANWRGGKSRVNQTGRSKAQYADWKNAVLANAGWKCVGCGLEHGHVCECCGHRVLLHAHHIKPFSEVPELRYEPSNGQALCERCHWKVHHKKLGELLETP